MMKEENSGNSDTFDHPHRLPSELDAALRPPSFADFTGQQKTIERLEVMVGAAVKREEPLKHVLLCGPPGLGKTTLAHIIGKELELSLIHI